MNIVGAENWSAAQTPSESRLQTHAASAPHAGIQCVVECVVDTRQDQLIAIEFNSRHKNAGLICITKGLTNRVNSRISNN